MKRLIFALLALAQTGHLAYAGKSVSDEKHEEWNSRIVYDGDDVRARALTSYSDVGGLIVLVLDRNPGNCDVQYISMNIVADDPAKISLVTDPEVGALRIDEMPIHNIKYKLQLVKGERIFFASVIEFDGENSLINELAFGKTIRFKLTQGEKQYFLRFPLAGYVAAAERTKALCKKIKPPKNDGDYFNQDTAPSIPKLKSDRSYFPT